MLRDLARRVALTVVVVVLGAIPGCVIEPVPFEGLLCPCASPFVCNDGTGMCVEEVSSVCGRSGASPSALSVTRFERWWVTAEQTRLRWALSDPTSVNDLAVDVAASPEALANGDFTTVDSATHPELGRAFLPGTMGVDPVTSTILDGLDPDTNYTARLVVTDGSGAVACSAPLTVRTGLAPLRSVPIFEEALSPGAYFRMPCSNVGTDGALAEGGASYVEHGYRCELADVEGTPTPISVCTEPTTPAESCWANVGFDGAAIPVTMNPGDFTTAYLEVSVATDDARSAYWSSISMSVGNVPYAVEQITVRSDGNYRRYEVPLSAMTRLCSGACGEERLTHAALAGGVTGMWVGMALGDGSTLRYDSVRVRW